MLETDHAQDAKFRENFFRDFKDMLKEYPPVSDDPYRVKLKEIAEDGTERGYQGEESREV